MVVACLLGVVACDGTNQVQVVLDLPVPTPEAVLVQMTLVDLISSLGRVSQTMASVEPRHGSEP